jgi:hydroxyacylglutathione hydrolase/adenylyltransferase/sulfurtransferase
MGSAFSSDEIDVDPARVARALESGDATVVDVREQYERDVGHIELERLASQADSIDRDRPVIFQCRLGARSAMAAQAFRAAGHEAYSLAGGIDRWHSEGRPLRPNEGYVADH